MIDKDILNLGEKVVLKLMESYTHNSFCIGFDNFFTSLELLRLLRENIIGAIGTLTMNHHDIPEVFI